MTERRHQGRVALVTGAGAGIGRAIATRLADEGCALVCTDVRCDAAAETAAQINRASGQAIAFEADVRDRRQIETALAGAIEAFGRLNYYYNAGCGQIGLISAMVVSQRAADPCTCAEVAPRMRARHHGRHRSASPAAGARGLP